MSHRVRSTRRSDEPTGSPAKGGAPEAAPEPEGSCGTGRRRATNDPILAPLFAIAPQLDGVRCRSCGGRAEVCTGPKGIAIACRTGCKQRVLVREVFIAALAERMAVTCDACGEVFVHEMGIDGPHLRCPNDDCGHSSSWNTVRTRLLRERRLER